MFVWEKMIREDWLRFTVSSVRKSSALLMRRFGCHNLTLRFLFNKVVHIDSLCDKVSQHPTISEWSKYKKELLLINFTILIKISQWHYEPTIKQSQATWASHQLWMSLCEYKTLKQAIEINIYVHVGSQSLNNNALTFTEYHKVSVNKSLAKYWESYTF